MLAVAAALLIGGCKKGNSPGPAPQEIKAFDTATQEVKQAWQAALEADHANDYAKGMTLYYALLRQPLTPTQRDAVARLSTGLNQRLTEAVEKGDATAQAALQELRQHAPNRPR
jgi:hypothetical protein